MGLYAPGALFANEGPENGRRKLVVVAGSVDVADVVQQRRNDPVQVGAVPPCAGRRLQRVLKTCDPVAGKALVQRFQGAEQALRRVGGVSDLVLGEEGVVLPVALLHLAEFDRFHGSSSIRAGEPGAVCPSCGGTVARVRGNCSAGEGSTVHGFTAFCVVADTFDSLCYGNWRQDSGFRARNQIRGLADG